MWRRATSPESGAFYHLRRMSQRLTPPLVFDGRVQRQKGQRPCERREWRYINIDTNILRIVPTFAQRFFIVELFCKNHAWQYNVLCFIGMMGDRFWGSIVIPSRCCTSQCSCNGNFWTHCNHRSELLNLRQDRVPAQRACPTLSKTRYQIVGSRTLLAILFGGV